MSLQNNDREMFCNEDSDEYLVDSDECLVDSDGCLIDNDGDAETDMEDRNNLSIFNN